MAQCFVSTYRNHYRWQDPQTTPSAKPYDKFMSVIPPEDIWIDTDSSKDQLDLDVWEKRVRKCYLRRQITTYQLAYCKNMIAKLIGESQDDSQFENELLKYCEGLYHPEPRPKIAAPLAGTRKIFGYIRPSRNYTPLTDYQHFYGQTAYRILKGHVKAQPEQQENKPEEHVLQDSPEMLQCPCRCCRS